jgi:SAM-dependent methyltransferase
MAGDKTRGVETLEATRLFWNASPCGAQETFQERYRHRLALEPWVLDVLNQIAAHHRQVLEIGCGQGTDGIILCSLLPPDGHYQGVDYSDASVASAQRAAQEATASLALHVTPSFRVGNAERLDLPSDSVECVYSNGVLHHTANPPQAFAEVRRVLRPGGEAFITLYRRPSVKVGAAKLMRSVQRGLDRVLRQDRSLYRLIGGRHMPKLLGTMLLEGFGVPVLEWYSRKDIERHFAGFTILSLQPVGYNFPFRQPASKGWTNWGYMWFLRVRKPA